MLYWWYENGSLNNVYDPDNGVYTLVDYIAIAARHIDGVIVATTPPYWDLVHRLAQEDVLVNHNLRVLPGVKLQSVSDYPNYAFRRATEEWANNTVYTAANGHYPGARVQPTTTNGYSYLCTRGGTSAIIEPTWPTTVGETVTEASGVEWLCQPWLPGSAYLQSEDGWNQVGIHIADYIASYKTPGGGERGMDDYNPNTSFVFEYEGLTDDCQWLVLADSRDLSDLSMNFDNAMNTHASSADLLWYPANAIAGVGEDQDEFNTLWGGLWSSVLNVGVQSRLFISNELSGPYHQENAESAGNAADAAQTLYQPGTTTIPAINIYNWKWTPEQAAQLVVDNNIRELDREHYLYAQVGNGDLAAFAEAMDALLASSSSSSLQVEQLASSSSILIPPPNAPEGKDRPYRRNANLPTPYRNVPVTAQRLLELKDRLGDWLQGNVHPDFDDDAPRRLREDFDRNKDHKSGS